MFIINIKLYSSPVQININNYTCTGTRRLTGECKSEKGRSFSHNTLLIKLYVFDKSSVTKKHL